MLLAIAMLVTCIHVLSQLLVRMQRPIRPCLWVLERVAILVVLRMVLHHVHHYFIFKGTIGYPLFFSTSVINSFLEYDYTSSDRIENT